MIVLTVASDHSGSFDPTVLLTWITCLTILLGGALAVVKYGRKVVLMVEDFNGTPARPGVESRPGVMKRMQLLDEQVATIHAEVNYNHGGSIKDAVDRIDASVQSGVSELRTLKDQNAEKLRRLNQIEDTISDLHGKYLTRMAGVDADLKGLHEAGH